MDSKFIKICKSKQNLVLGLLVALFLVLIFVQTISIADIHDVTVKDFSIMRPVSVPTQGDVRTAMNIFKDELGDSYSFDHLYNNVYSLIVFGIISVFFCFTKFNKGLLSKIVTLFYGVFAAYSLFATNNMAYILSTYDSTYILKVIVAILIVLVSIFSIVMIMIDLSKNGWLKEVNVHIFLNSINSILLIAGTAIMFIPFTYEKYTASIMGYMLLPSNYANGFDAAFNRLLGDMTFNSAVIIPILLFVIGVLTCIFAAGYYRNILVPVLSTVWAVLLALGCFINPLMALDGKMIIYIVIAVASIAVAVLNFIQHYKANEIYRK